MSPVIISGNSVNPNPATVVRDLEVWIDRGLTMSTHVSKVVSGCFAVLRQLYSIRRSVSQESLIGLVVSVVLTRLDHCNALLAGFPAYQLECLHYAINAAARTIYRTGVGRYVGFTPMWERTICGIRAGELDISPVRGFGNTRTCLHSYG